MADDLYFYNGRYSGPEIDSLLDRVKATSGEGALQAKIASVRATEMPYGSSISVTLEENLNGTVNLVFGVPRGPTGARGPKGPTGDVSKVDFDAFVDKYNVFYDKAVYSPTFRGHYTMGRDELSYSWSEIQAQARTGAAGNIRIGDYKNITLSTGETLFCVVAGIDTYYSAGFPFIGRHIDFVSSRCLANTSGKFKYNNVNQNNGNSYEQSPWLASKLYRTLNNETDGVITTLPSDLQSVIIEKKAYLEHRYNSSGSVVISNRSGTEWGSLGKLWLPSDLEVFGNNYGLSNVYAGTNIQYPLFKGSYSYIVKNSTDSAYNCDWWTISIPKDNSSGFLKVSSRGALETENASSESVSVPLCFRVG